MANTSWEWRIHGGRSGLPVTRAQNLKMCYKIGASVSYQIGKIIQLLEALPCPASVLLAREGLYCYWH